MTETVQKTTLSPETRQLVNLCAAVQDGSESFQKLAGASALRLQQLEQARDGFFAGVDAQGADFLSAYQSHVDKIEAEFQAYSDVLEQLLQEGEADLSESAAALVSASEGLRKAMAEYEEAYMSAGPSHFPIINLLHNLQAAVTSGRAGAQLWQSTCERYQSLYAAALAEVEKSPAGQEEVGVQRREAYAAILACLNELEHRGAKTQVDDILARLSTAHVDLHRSFESFHRARICEGPSASPNVNWLVEAATGVMNGIYAPQILEALAGEYLQVVSDNLRELKALSKNDLESATLTEELSIMLEALESIEDSLAFLLDYAQGVDTEKEQLEEALEELIESGDVVAESTRVVEDYNRRANQVTCVQCNTVQQVGSHTCAHCGAQLPRAAESGVYSRSGAGSFQVLEGDPHDVMRDEIMTDVASALFDKCEAFMRDLLPLEELTAEVDRCLSATLKAEDSLAPLVAPAIPQEATEEERQMARDFVELADDALALLELGIAECRMGLQQIKQGAEADNPASVREGMAAYYQGTQKMWQVRRLDHQLSEYIGAAEPEEAIMDTTESVLLSA